MKQAVFFSLLLAGALYASSSATIDGMSAFKQGQYDKAMQLFLDAANKGDAEAQLCIGAMYFRGKGIEKDSKKAAYWYQKAATAGNANAQCTLGSMFHQGNGVQKSEARAYQWYSKAAQQGNSVALKRLKLLCDDNPDICK